MDANVFLKSTTFSVSEDIKLSPLEPDKVKKVTKVNTDTIEFVQSETLSGLLEASSTADNSVDPDYASYQPLNEAGLMTAGTSTAQSAMGANVNNALGVQSQSLESLKTAEQSVPPIEGEEQPAIVSETEELILGAQTVISNALLGIANNADKAEGAQKISAPTQLELGGNSIYLISETMIHTTTPVVSTVAEVISNQAKVIQITADLVSENVKNRYSNIEGTNTDVATNKITTTIARDISVASEVNTTALGKHTVNADVVEAYSQSLIELRSTKSTRITADENIINQAGNISITASPGSKKSGNKLESPGEVGEFVENTDGSKDLTATNAAGEKVRFKGVINNGEPKWKNAGAQLEGAASNPNPAKSSTAAGNITILANGESGSGGSLTIVNNNQITSSKEGQTNLAKDINNLAENSVKTTGNKISSEATTLASFSSGRSIQISTSSSMTLMTGGQTFQGLRKSDIGKMAKIGDIGGPIELTEIPKLPKLPSGINVEGLKECIKKNKKGRLNQQVEDVVDDVEEGAEVIIEAIEDLLGLNNNEEDPNFDDIKLNKKPKKKQEVEAPSIEEAGRREKEHPLPTGKDDNPIGGSLDEAGSSPQGVKLPKKGPLSETTSPTNQSVTQSQNEIMGAAAVIEGGTDIFTEDEEDTEDILDENKEEDLRGSGDELVDTLNPDQGFPSNEVMEVMMGSIESYTLEEYLKLATIFTQETEGYNVLGNLELPIKGFLLYPEDYYEVVIKYLKQKYDPNSLDKSNNLITIRGVELTEKEHFEQYYNPESKPPSSDITNFPNGVGKLWVDYLEERMLSKAAVGGLLSFAKNAVKFVKANINISDNLDDLKSSNAQRILGGLGKTLSPSLGGEYFTDASNIISQSSFLQNVYKNVKGTFDPYVRDAKGNITTDVNGEPIRNANNNTPGFINSVDLAGLQKVLDSATNIISADKIQISQSLVVGLKNIKESEVFLQQGYSLDIEKSIINLIQESTEVTQKEAEIFYEGAKDRFKLLFEGDLEGAFTDLALDNVISAILGPANTQAIKDLGKLYSGTKRFVLDGIATGKEAYETGKEIYNTAGEVISRGEDLYTAIKTAPAIMSMMNYYEVPTLNQVNTLLTCLDIKNNVKDIMDGVKNIGSSISKLESLGGDLFNILDGVIDNVGEADDIVKERVETLTFIAEEEGLQTTPRIINESSNTNLLADTDLMNRLTNGLVSGSIAQNTNLNTKPLLTETNRFETLNQTIATQGEVVNLTETQDVDLNECPPVYDAFVETNESINPNDWEIKTSDEELLKTIETLPRLTQMYNSVLELPSGQVIEGLTQTQVIDIKNTKVNIKLDPCFGQVKLNAVESSIEVLELQKGVMLFKMEQSDLLKVNNKDINPAPNTIIQVYIEQFFDINKDRVLTVERKGRMYSPLVYNFKITKYKLEENIGLAQLIPTQSRIYLRNVEDNLIYNYNIMDIGVKLEPQILDSYVVL